MPRTTVSRIAFSLVMLTLFASEARAAIKCVNPGGTDGCFSTIQAAINAAGHLDTIQIAAGTYNERVSMVPPNNKWLTIQGAGPEKTIVDGTGVGAATAPVFQFQNGPANGPTVTVSDLTIRGGYRGVNAGGGIRLTLRNVVVRDNGIGSGAGVFNGGSIVTIINSTIRDNRADDPFFGCDGSGGSGGGIASLCGGGSYIVINSAIVNNWARAGGGAVFVNGEQTIINSTFSGNTALDIGAAMMSFADNTFISNSTFANNTARPAGGALAMFSARNELKANVLAGNTGDNCLLAEPLDSLGYNVSSDASCALTAAGDLLNTSALLGPLQNNGGPTPTHALLPGPGLDHVPSSICPAPAADQRGVERAQRTACDSGAFEATDETPPVISVPSGITVNATTPGGAGVSFTASAADAFDGDLATTCAPASGAMFPVGDTTVTCTASDSAGNTGSASFVVHVAGADEQLWALFELVSSVHASDDLQALVLNAQAFLLRDKPGRACDVLATLEQRVDRRAKKTGETHIDAATAAAIYAAIAEVRGALGC